MDEKNGIRIQLHMNATFVLILDGSVEAMITQLKSDRNPQMQIEIELLRRIYEKFQEARPLIDALQNRGRQITHAQNN